jgi:hypothetical protein
MPRIEGKVDERGLLVDVKIMMTSSRVEALKRAGKPYAKPMTIVALVDTGASCSCVDRNVIAGLGLGKRGTVSIHTPSTGTGYIDRAQYDACLVLGEGQAGALVFTLPVIESEFASQGFLALIGRDVLGSCMLVYDGPASKFTLEWNAAPHTGRGRRRRDPGP